MAEIALICIRYIHNRQLKDHPELTTIYSSLALPEDEFGKPEIVEGVAPQKGRTRTGSSAEMAVDQLQASEKLIAGMCVMSVTLL